MVTSRLFDPVWHKVPIVPVEACCDLLYLSLLNNPRTLRTDRQTDVMLVALARYANMACRAKNSLMVRHLPVLRCSPPIPILLGPSFPILRFQS